MHPRSTVIITGGTGQLGSCIAKDLETLYPRKYHLILTCRNPEDSRALSLYDALKSKQASFRLEALDLADLEKVKTFCESVRARIKNGEIPRLIGGGIVNCAALMSFLRDLRTSEGVDRMYTVNVLAPALLVRSLLPELMGEGGAKVVNIGSAAYVLGTVEYFKKQKEVIKEALEGEKLSFMETMKRYGSAKLLAMMTAYALQRQLYMEYPTNKLRIIVLDPGGMSGKGRLQGDENHWIFSILYAVLGIFRPVLRVVKKDALNPPEIPGRAISGLFGELKDDGGAWERAKHFVLDDEKGSSGLSKDDGVQDKVWGLVMGDLGLPDRL